MKKTNLMNRKVVKAMSFAISATLLLQPMTAMADEAPKAEPAGAAKELQVSDDSEKAAVQKAENAAKTADDAKEAAQDAYQKAEDAAKAAEDLAKEVGKQVGDDKDKNNLNDGLDKTVADTKQAVSDNETAMTQAATTAEGEIGKIANDTSVTDIATDKSDAATAEGLAQDAEQDSADDLQDTKDAAAKLDKTAAQKAAKEAADAAAEAQTQADNAKDAYDDAYQLLSDYVDELARLEKVADDADKDIADKKAAIEKKIEDAKKELKTAADDLAKAKTDLKIAKEDEAATQAALADIESGKAADAAKDAADAAEVALNNLADLKTEKDTYQGLKDDVTAAQENLDQKIADQTRINGEQDAIISAQTIEKNRQEGISGQKQAELNTLAGQISPLETERAQKAAIVNNSDLKKAAAATTSTVKSVRHNVPYFNSIWDWGLRDEYTYYTQSEIDAAKNAISAANTRIGEIDAALSPLYASRTTVTSEKSAADQAATDAQTKIDNANGAKDEAERAVKMAQTALTNANTQKKLVSLYEYAGSTEITYMDKAEQEEYKKLLAEMKDQQSKYNEISSDVKAYHDATKKMEYTGIDLIDAALSDIVHTFNWDKLTEWKLEEKYRKWDWSWDGGSETHWTFTKNGDNEAVLITMQGTRLTITKVDEAEFGAFSATFDKAAAAQAAEKAAQAAADAAEKAKAEKAAFEKYNKAQKALQDALDELAELKVSTVKVDRSVLKAAQDKVTAAQADVDSAKTSWDNAQTAADEAKKNADEAKKIADGIVIPGSSSNDPSDDDNDTTDPTTQNPVNNLPANNQQGGQQGGQQGAGNQQGQVNIEDEDSAKAATPNQDTTVKKDNTSVEETIVEEEDTAKAALPTLETEEDVQNFNYLWLLLLAALAVIIEEIIRRNYNKNKAQ